MITGPYCELGDVTGYLKQYPAKKIEIYNAVKSGVSEALKIFRSKRICHLDVRADNIVLEIKNEVLCARLIDYGLALSDSDIPDKYPDKKYFEYGLRIYPETELNFDRIDKYSLGIVLRDILRHPEQFEYSDDKIVPRQFAEDLGLPSETPPTEIQFIKSLLRDPSIKVKTMNPAFGVKGFE